jgi:hypothetical protein
MGIKINLDSSGVDESFENRWEDYSLVLLNVDPLGIRVNLITRYSSWWVSLLAEENYQTNAQKLEHLN